jgi:putative endonuclease
VASNHLAVGRLGEDRAASWYTEHGYRVIARNWRCGIGEIDLVCRRGDVLVVIEVKARRASRHGQPFEAVTAAKQRRLRRLAGAYLRDQGPRRSFVEVRFDVVSILGSSLEVIESAF